MQGNLFTSQDSKDPTNSSGPWTVSELTSQLKELLETHFAQVSVLGEISNFRAHSSGHYYFTLKDEGAQISAVMFRGANRQLKFEVEDGLEVILTGRITVYEPRGNYQIVVEKMEPQGLGALQLAFEQLKARLAKEGLFSEERKRSLPFLPQTIGLITSPTGAVLRDMVRILHRRHPGVNILLYPVSVQGESAAPEIAEAIEVMNQQGEADVLIVGRGGGSMEDLWAFNAEIVARAMAASKIPTVSAVGHETDFTIADFVADLRAPTPSAAAELAVPILAELEGLLTEGKRHLLRNLKYLLQDKASQLEQLRLRLPHPKHRLERLNQDLDYLQSQLRQNMVQLLKHKRHELRHALNRLEGLSPLAILKRGYSIVHQLKDGEQLGPILTQARQTKIGDKLAIDLAQGRLHAEVTKKWEERG